MLRNCRLALLIKEGGRKTRAIFSNSTWRAEGMLCEWTDRDERSRLTTKYSLASAVALQCGRPCDLSQPVVTDVLHASACCSIWKAVPPIMTPTTFVRNTGKLPVIFFSKATSAEQRQRSVTRWTWPWRELAGAVSRAIQAIPPLEAHWRPHFRLFFETVWVSP